MDQLLLVEDDVPTRHWLEEMLRGSNDPQLAFSCGTVKEALDWLRSGAVVDIVLTDLGLPDGSGIDVIREAARRPGCEVLVLSIFGDEKNVLAAIDAGAGGYLLKDGSLDSMREHLHCLRQGGSPLSPRIARTLIRRNRSPIAGAVAENDASLLSQREHDVLTGIGKGFSYSEVASALCISTNTVRTHVRKIYEKLAVNSKTEALYEFNRIMVEQGKATIR